MRVTVLTDNVRRDAKFRSRLGGIAHVRVTVQCDDALARIITTRLNAEIGRILTGPAPHGFELEDFAECDPGPLAPPKPPAPQPPGPPSTARDPRAAAPTAPTTPASAVTKPRRAADRANED